MAFGITRKPSATAPPAAATEPATAPVPTPPPSPQSPSTLDHLRQLKDVWRWRNDPGGSLGIGPEHD